MSPALNGNTVRFLPGTVTHDYLKGGFHEEKKFFFDLK